MKIIIKNVITEDSKEVIIKDLSSTTYESFLNENHLLHSSDLDLPANYHDLLYSVGFDGYIPFIIKKNGVLINPVFSDFSLLDIKNTFFHDSDSIIIEIGRPQVGGIGEPDFFALWDSILPYLNTIIVIYTAGKIVEDGIKLGNFLFNSLKKISSAPKPEETVLQVNAILSRDKWNHNELSETLNLSKEETKALLKAFGYEYNNSIMMYSATHFTQGIRNYIKEQAERQI